GDGLQDPFVSQLVAADEFDHDVDNGVAHHVQPILSNQDLVADQAPGHVHIAHRHSRDLDTPARPARNFFSVARQHLPGAAAHHAQTQQTNFYGTHFSRVSFLALTGPTPSLRNISLMPRTAWRVRCSFSISAKRT